VLFFALIGGLLWGSHQESIGALAGVQRRRSESYPVPACRQPGGTLYFAVLLQNGKTWNLEDLQLQSMESGSGSATRKN